MTVRSHKNKKYISTLIEDEKKYVETKMPPKKIERMTLQRFLTYKLARKAALESLAKIHSQENFYFHNAVISFKKNYQNKTSDSNRECAENIFNNFIRDDAAHTVNISGKLRKRMYANRSLAINRSGMFDDVLDEVRSLMVSTFTVIRFTKSLSFKKFSKAYLAQEFPDERHNIKIVLCL